jgi:hypothetical protein
LLHDPLGSEPIIVSGSANFSDASTKENDENMIVVQGDLQVADIYFTEFNRLWNHYYYYFRSVQESLAQGDHDNRQESLFLVEDVSWIKKYEPDTASVHAEWCGAPRATISHPGSVFCAETCKKFQRSRPGPCGARPRRDK